MNSCPIQRGILPDFITFWEPIDFLAPTPLLVDLSRRQVMLEDQEVKVSPTEFDILQRLILAGGATVMYEELLGYDDSELLGDTDAAELLRYHIRNLRQKLREAGIEEDIVLNVRGVGYRLGTRPSRL